MELKDLKKLFKLFQDTKDSYELYNKVEKLIDELTHETEGKLSAYYYSVLVNLSNSINNAGHEERRSKDIDYLNSEERKISTNYEEFLP